MQIHSCHLRRAIKTCSLQRDSFLILSFQQQPSAVFTLCPYLFTLLFPHWVQISKTRWSHRQKATCDPVLHGTCVAVSRYNSDSSSSSLVLNNKVVFLTESTAVTKTLRYDPTGPKSKCTDSTWRLRSGQRFLFLLFLTFHPTTKDILCIPFCAIYDGTKYD